MKMEGQKYGLILIMGVVIGVILGIVSYWQARNKNVSKDQKSEISASDSKKNETAENTPKNLK